MYFSDLKTVYEAWEKEKRKGKDRIENKQGLNLSDHAYLVLQNDMTIFLPQKEQTDSGKIPSGFINQIFCNFRQSANSSIAYKLHEKELDYYCLLQEVKSREKKDIIKSLIKDYKTMLLKEKERYLKETGNSFYFRVNKDNLEYLATEGNNENEYYNDNISFYIKAVIEEYAERPYADREYIYYKEHIDEIELARSTQKVLKILLKNEHNGNKKDFTKYMKVIKIDRDKEHLYNYVVGFMNDGKTGPWKPGAIRLTSIYECNKLEQSAFISNKERESVERIIKKHGVQYLPAGGSDYKVVVEFTPRGEKMYQRMLHLRPLYTKKLDDRVYEFHCSKLQAQSYFFKFGQDVKILEPLDLAKDFLTKYQAAAKNYGEAPL